MQVRKQIRARKTDVSGWAQRFIEDDPPGEYEEPEGCANVTPRVSQPFILWQREQAANARARAAEHRRKAGAYVLRSFIGFVVWQFHFGFWPSCIAVCIMLICGLMAMLNTEAWNIARIESNMKP